MLIFSDLQIENLLDLNIVKVVPDSSAYVQKVPSFDMLNSSKLIYFDKK